METEIEIEQNLTIYTEIRAIFTKIIKDLSNDINRKYFKNFNELRTKFEYKSSLPNGDTTLALIFNWVSFDTIVDKQINGPLIQYYYKRNAKNMNELEKKICKSLFSSRISIFEIQETKPGLGLRVLDLFTNKRHFIYDKSLSANAVKWDLFIERILTVNDIKCITGYPMAFDRNLAKYLVKEAKKEAEIQSKKNNTPYINELALLLKEEQYRFFKRMSLEINREVQVLTPELDPVHLLTLTYTHEKRQAIKELFSTIKEMKLTEESKDKDFYNFVVESEKNPIPKPENKVEQDSIIYRSNFNIEDNSLLVLGTIELTDKKLIVDVLSKRRFDYLDEKIIKKISTYLQLENKNERGLEEHPTRGIKTFKRETYEKIAQLENFEEIIKNQFGAWSTQKQDSFNGLSILEASEKNTEKYKEEILDQVKTYENTFLHLEKNFGIELDKSDLTLIKERIGLKNTKKQSESLKEEKKLKRNTKKQKKSKKKIVSVEEQERNIRKIFKLKESDELPSVTNKSLQIYYEYLKENLVFPFVGMYYVEVGPFEDKEYKLVIVQIEPFIKLDDDFYGLIVQGKEGGRKMIVPLGDIEIKEEGPNRDLVEEYLTWFWNNR